MDSETKRRRDAFKLALGIFNEVEGHRYNRPVLYFNIGEKIGFEAIKTQTLLTDMVNNNIFNSPRGKAVSFTLDGYKLIQDTIENPDGAPYYFPSMSDLDTD